MRTAVVRVVVDADGALDAPAYEAGLRSLRDQGLEIVASPAERLPAQEREIELIVTDDRLHEHIRAYIAQCEKAFGCPAHLGVVTYISRGTDDDARGILLGFDIDGQVERSMVGDEELVIVTVQAADLRRVPEGGLHTALEAALNAEVRIVAVS